MRIRISELKSLVDRALSKKYDPEDAALISDVVLFGELSGKTSHGLVRLVVGNSSILAQNPAEKPLMTKKTKISSIIEGNNNPGMLVGALAMKEVVKLAKENGFGVVGTRGSFSSSGCLTYFLKNIAGEGFISIIMAQSPLSTAPHGGIQPLFGTNPISFGIPAEKGPLIFDMATSAISFGAILRAKTLGLKLPDKVAIDKNGEVTMDPLEAVTGATLTFDNSYKGSGLAMMVEVLAGLWPGADFCGLNSERGWGNLFMAFSPDLLSNSEKFKKEARNLIETVRNSKSKDGSKIRISGELTLRTIEENMTRGEVKVDKEVVNQIRKFISDNNN